MEKYPKIQQWAVDKNNEHCQSFSVLQKKAKPTVTAKNSDFRQSAVAKKSRLLSISRGKKIVNRQSIAPKISGEFRSMGAHQYWKDFGLIVNYTLYV